MTVVIRAAENVRAELASRALTDKGSHLRRASIRVCNMYYPMQFGIGTMTFTEIDRVAPRNAS
jgi:hypothetical protein